MISFGRTNGAPYRGYPLMFRGGGGTSLGEWEHNSNNNNVVISFAHTSQAYTRADIVLCPVLFDSAGPQSLGMKQ